MSEAIENIAENEPAYNVEIAGNPSIANDHLRDLGKHYKAKADLEAIRDNEKEKIDLWFDRVSEPVEKEIRFAENSLQYYFINAPDDQRTISLPNGEFGRKKVATRLAIGDKKAVLKWVQEEGLESLLDYKPQIVKKKLDAHFAASGEIPEGCDVEHEHDRYEYRPTNDVDLEGAA